MKATSDFHEITVFGARGTAMMVLQSLHEHYPGRANVRALIDDLENGFLHPQLGVPVISSQERLALYPDLPVLISVTSPALRERTALRLAAEGATLADIVSPGMNRIDPSVRHGPGAICAPFTRVGPNVHLGTGTIVLATMLAHDVTLGDYSAVSVHASVLGHVRIGRGVTIAPHAVIGNGSARRPLHIGDGAVIGIGATVIRDVPPGARMIGNPAMTVRQFAKLDRLLRDPRT